MEYCVICKSNNVTILDKEKNCMICKNCDVVYKKNPPDYRNRFENNQIKKESKLIKLTAIVIKRFWKIVSDQYINYLQTYTNLNFSNALDVGAGYGHFVKSLCNHQIDAYGLEADTNFIKKSIIPNKIKHGYFDETYKSSKKFDLISFTSMIFYLQDPISVLVNAKKMLNDEGIIFVSTYNPSSSMIHKNILPELIESGVTMMLSKKNFEQLEDIGLKLINYSTYEPHIYIDRINGNGNALSEAKIYFKYHIKKSYSPRGDGHIAFLLLKSIN